MKNLILLSSIICLFTTNWAIANCSESRFKELQSRNQVGKQQVVKYFIQGENNQLLLRAFQDIAVSETYLIVHRCLKASSTELIMRGIKINNQMDIPKASYSVFSQKAQQDLGIDLDDVRNLFSKTIYVTEKEVL